MEFATWDISDSISLLNADPWRNDHPFSADIAQVHATLFDPAKSRQEVADALSSWLAENQPCLFGRMEANQKRLAFCVLNENDLERSDQEIRERIHHERMDWKRRAESGDSHAFLIVAVSERIARARPDGRLRQLASRLCELYLGVGDADKIHVDDLILRTNDGRQERLRQWPVGVNYFSAQGDGRWWHDHRFPGGMAYSMNSVGHMARRHVEQKLRNSSQRAAQLQDAAREKLVYWALRKAMETIGVRVAGSGRGTWLMERGKCREDKDPPAFEARQTLFGEFASYSENRYFGLYHTDHTIPSPYFDERLWRREELPIRDDLFFTYLHSLSDEDYLGTGIGRELVEKQTEP